MGRRLRATGGAVLIAAGVFAPATASGGAAHSRPCHVYPGDAAARELVATAQTGAETIATDHNGSYTSVTRVSLRALVLISITAREAKRRHERAYLVTASGTPNSYVLVARAFDRHTYTLTNVEGNITRTARLCGHVRFW
jgi:hypothetical protein